MSTISLSLGEPFLSPAWESNFAVFSSPTGEPIPAKEAKRYISKACAYAQKHEVYLVPERFIIDDTQCMCLIAPNGRVLGAQKALFNNRSIPLTKGQGNTIELITTELGTFFLCVDVDVYHPEVAKIAYNMGAQVVICSQYFSPMQYSIHRAVAGVWSIAQSNNFFSVGVSNEYNAVCAPRELTRHNDGFLESPTKRMPVTAKVVVSEAIKLPRKPLLNRKIYTVHRNELLGETRQDKRAK